MWSWRRSSPAPEGLGRDRVHVRRRATCGPAARRRPCGRGAARGPPAGQACWTPPRRGKVGPAGGIPGQGRDAGGRRPARASRGDGLDGARGRAAPRQFETPPAARDSPERRLRLRRRAAPADRRAGRGGHRGGVGPDRTPAAPFAILGGDLASPDLLHRDRPLTSQEYEPSYRLLAEILARLPCPARFLVGNHDDRVAFNRVLRAAAPTANAPHYYGFDYQAYHFVALDSQEPGQAGGFLDPAQLEWLH